MDSAPVSSSVHEFAGGRLWRVGESNKGKFPSVYVNTGLLSGGASRLSLPQAPRSQEGQLR